MAGTKTTEGTVLGELDLYLLGEGNHRRLWEVLGPKPLREGFRFAVWAPNARSVRVVGDWNGWRADEGDELVNLGPSGVWAGVATAARPGQCYKLVVEGADGVVRWKADPMARQAEVPPRTASVLPKPSEHTWGDGEWMARRQAARPWAERLSIHELHAASWRRRADEGNRSLTWDELAEELPAWVEQLGFTHVELMPIATHPFEGSWGYQITGFYAPQPTFGDPDGLRRLVDALHRRGIGVIMDWVPGHFAADEHGLIRFDGTALYEHLDWRRGWHPEWGTLQFNHGRNEVRNFLVANALYWLEEFHIDGLRVDAVASMLYRDYARGEGAWVPNRFGGREDLEAVELLRSLNVVAHEIHPGVVTIAEESTAWPGVSRPVHAGGLGFDFKWNMGWMHDTLAYFSRDPIFRQWHSEELTFGLVYAFSEQYVLPLSHDEVVHGKRALVSKMPGDRWQRYANLRALLAWMWAHPGKKLVFMGTELGEEDEWWHGRGLDPGVLSDPLRRGVFDLLRSLNGVLAAEPALWEVDTSVEGFRWIDFSDSAANVLAFLRCPASPEDGRMVACVANLSPVPREGYRLGLPEGGRWVELVNTDSELFGGSGVGNLGAVVAEDEPWHGLEHSACFTLPPLGVLWLAPEQPSS